MEVPFEDTNSEDKPIDIDAKTTQVDEPSSIGAGDAVKDSVVADPLADGCGDNQKENSSHNDLGGSVLDSDPCVDGSEQLGAGDALQATVCDEVQPADHDEVQATVCDEVQPEDHDEVQATVCDEVQPEESNEGQAVECDEGQAVECNVGQAVECDEGQAVECDEGQVECNEGQAVECDEGQTVECDEGQAVECDEGQVTECDSEQAESCDMVQDDGHHEEMKTDSDTAQADGSSQDTGVDGDLSLLTLDGNTVDKHAVLINELQHKEKIISKLRLRVGELEAQLGMKRPSSKFPDNLSPSLKRARGRSLTPSRRVAINPKSLKRARLCSPMYLNSDWSSAHTGQTDVESQSSGLSSEDLDVIALEVSHRLSSSLVTDVTAQVLQHVLPLVDLRADGGDGDIVNSAGLATSFLSNVGDGTDAVDTYPMDSEPIATTSAGHSGQSLHRSVVDVEHAASVVCAEVVHVRTITRQFVAQTDDDVAGCSEQVTTLTGSPLVVHQQNAASSVDASSSDGATSLKGTTSVVKDTADFVIPSTGRVAGVSSVTGSPLIVRSQNNNACFDKVSPSVVKDAAADFVVSSPGRVAGVTSVTGSPLIVRSHNNNACSDKVSPSVVVKDTANTVVPNVGGVTSLTGHPLIVQHNKTDTVIPTKKEEPSKDSYSTIPRTLTSSSNTVKSLTGSLLIVKNTPGSLPSANKAESLIGDNLIIINPGSSSHSNSEGSHLISLQKDANISVLNKDVSSSYSTESFNATVAQRNANMSNRIEKPGETQSTEQSQKSMADDMTNNSQINIDKPDSILQGNIVESTPTSTTGLSGDAATPLEMTSVNQSNGPSVRVMAASGNSGRVQKSYLTQKTPSSVGHRKANIAGTHLSSAPQPIPSPSVPLTSSGQIHIPNIFRQRHIPMQSATSQPRHVAPPLPVQHPVRMSASNRFGMNMHRIPVPANMGSASANAVLMQQLMNTPAGAQAARTLSHLTHMNRLSALQAQQRGIRPPLQNAPFPHQMAPLISPRASSAGPAMNLSQSHNMAMNAAAFRRAISSRVVTGQRLNMNNR